MKESHYCFVSFVPLASLHRYPSATLLNSSKQFVINIYKHILTQQKTLFPGCCYSNLLSLTYSLPRRGSLEYLREEICLLFRASGIVRYFASFLFFPFASLLHSFNFPPRVVIRCVHYFILFVYIFYRAASSFLFVFSLRCLSLPFYYFLFSSISSSNHRARGFDLIVFKTVSTPPWAARCVSCCTPFPLYGFIFASPFTRL